MEEEEQLEIIADTLVNLHFESDNGGENLRPIEGEDARQARQQFVRQYYRQLNLHHGSAIGSRRSTGSIFAVDPVVDRMEMAASEARQAQREQRQLNQPNLDIPVGQEYIYRAQ